MNWFAIERVPSGRSAHNGHLHVVRVTRTEHNPNTGALPQNNAANPFASPELLRLCEETGVALGLKCWGVFHSVGEADNICDAWANEAGYP